MEFWPENQSQSHLYSKFGTVPGRNCTHNYHDRHQATHYPLYYGEQQDPGRESSYWTVPGSRTGGAPQEYTSWTDQELTAPASSHFPFIIDRHPQQHQDLGEYQTHEIREREWTAAQRAAREYERGFLREGWQRRWEPCSPVQYNRDVSSKRSDSSYRELEAWAARYSHSLPRRRRIEAELRGASQGLLESSRASERDSRSGSDPRVAALQQAIQSANIRGSGLWDRGGKQQAPSYYPPQTPAIDTSHMLEMKEKIGYQRRMFSQPPGYIAPPPYNSPHKSSPVMHHCDTSWEQEGKRQAYWSQPTLRKQDVSADLQDHRKGETEDFTKPDGNRYTFPELEGRMLQRQGTDALQASSPISIQNTDRQHEDMLSLQQPQVLQAVQNEKINEEPPSKVIEGRKFRLNKKTGGMTIFCLVSRIADTSETPSFPLFTSQTNTQNTELVGVSEDLGDTVNINQTHKHADEVDFRAPSPTDGRDLKVQQEMPTCTESEVLVDSLSHKVETDDVYPEKANANEADSTFGRQVAQSEPPVSVKYPLWRQPSFTSRAETQSPSTCLKENSEDAESDNQKDSVEVQPIDIEVRRLDITKEDSKGLLVIDTTCVVVKMELIPSPKKEHVLFLDSTPQTEDSPLGTQLTVSSESIQSNSDLNEDVTIDQNAETNFLDTNEMPDTRELDSDLSETKAEGDISFPCMSSSPAAERETLEERAERILGIPLHDCIPEQQPEEDAMTLLDSCGEDQEVEPSPVTDNGIDDVVEIPEVTANEEQSQAQLEDSQTEDVMFLQENDDAKDQVQNEGCEDFAGQQEQVSSTSEENDIDPQLITDTQASAETETIEDPLLTSISKEGTTEQSQEKHESVENDSSSQLPFECLGVPTDLSNPSSLSLSPDCEAPNPAFSLMVSSSDLTTFIDEGPDPEFIAHSCAPCPENSSPLYAQSLQLTSPLLPGSSDFSLSSTPHTHHTPSPSPLDIIDRTEEAVSGAEDQDLEDETSQPINKEISDVVGGLAKDSSEEVVSQQHVQRGQAGDAACVTESSIIDKQQTQEEHNDPVDNVVEQTKDINILLQQLECVQAEDATCGKENYMTEDQLPKEVSEIPAGLLVQTISHENLTENQTELNNLQQQFDKSQEEDHSYLKEEQSQKVASAETTDVLGQILTKEKASDSQSQTQINILQDTEPQTEPSNLSPLPPSDLVYGVFQPPLDVLSPSELPAHPDAFSKSDSEFVSLLEKDSVCLSALHTCADDAPAAGIPKIVPPPLYLDSCEETPILLPNSSIPQVVDGDVLPDLPLKEEPQYPKSLWDAVNRIRKHTAPDSENEEEEVSELWDPESVGELGCLHVAENMNSEKIVLDEAGQQEVSTGGRVEDAEERQIQQDSIPEELSGHAEEDTLSCSSTCSRSSGDTVIVADEDEVDETLSDARMESETEYAEVCRIGEGEQRCTDETAAKEDRGDGDGSTIDGCSQSGEGPAEVATTTMKAEEVMETEQENDEEVFMPSEIAVSDEGKTESDSVK